MLDVCFIVEGTYPYVAGGVSSWINTLLTELSDLTFGIVFVGAEKKPKAASYPMVAKANVLRFTQTYIHDSAWRSVRYRKTPSSEAEIGGWARALATLYRHVRDDEGAPAHQAPLGRASDPGVTRSQALLRAARTLDLVGESLNSLEGLTAAELVSTRSFWDVFLETIQDFPSLANAPFQNLYWTAQAMHAPLVRLLRADVPRAAVYHTVSTGYAGLLAAYTARQRRAPLLLTEHGIYTRERKQELLGAEWVSPRGWFLEGEINPFLRWWVGLFRFMSRYAYLHSAAIRTLFRENLDMQLREGAPRSRCEIVPNGVTRTPPRRFERSERVRVVALVGRVTRIKDIETFMSAARCYRGNETYPPANFWVFGSESEEPDYATACRQHPAAEHVTFWGGKKPLWRDDYEHGYANIDCLVLTSHSEGQPLVILEAMTCGIPSVTTNVGACRELLESQGRFPECGIVADGRSPEELAGLIARVLSDDDLHRSMALEGMRRVQETYSLEKMISAYRDLYLLHGREHRGGTRYDVGLPEGLPC